MKKFIVLILALNMYLGVSAQFTPGDTLKSVSYTHLTLPTILLV